MWLGEQTIELLTNIVDEHDGQHRTTTEESRMMSSLLPSWTWVLRISHPQKESKVTLRVHMEVCKNE